MMDFLPLNTKWNALKKFHSVIFLTIKAYSDWKLSRSKKNKKSVKSAYMWLIRCIPSPLKSYSSLVWGTELKLNTSFIAWMGLLWDIVTSNSQQMCDIHNCAHWKLFWSFLSPWQFLCSFSFWKSWAFLTISTNVFLEGKEVKFVEMMRKLKM